MGDVDVEVVADWTGGRAIAGVRDYQTEKEASGQSAGSDGRACVLERSIVSKGPTPKEPTIISPAFALIGCDGGWRWESVRPLPLPSM